jgi:hypothetical protein
VAPSPLDIFGLSRETNLTIHGIKRGPFVTFEL